MDPELFVPLVFCLSGALIWIVAILTRHQRSMAEITHRRDEAGEETRYRVTRLENEVQELRDRLNAEIVAQDSMRDRLATERPPVPDAARRPDLENRA